MLHIRNKYKNNVSEDGHISKLIFSVIRYPISSTLFTIFYFFYALKPHTNLTCCFFDLSVDLFLFSTCTIQTT